MRVALLGALLLAACSPEINSDAYYCGPERFCPPDLECDDNSFTCVNPFQVDAFTCPAGSETMEPDDDRASASDIGEVTCGSLLLSNQLGCIVGDDADYVLINHDLSCNGADPHFELKLRFPVATAPLALELLDESGAVLGSGSDCTPEPNFSGREHLCLGYAPVEGETYFVRVRVADDAPDCGGDCRHNQYLLDVSYPLS